MIEIKTIEYSSPEYEQMVVLRDRILRAPLGLRFTKEDLEADKNDILCACLADNIVVACCILSHMSPSTVKLRQMAVDNSYQSKGLGKQLLAFAEKKAKEKGYKTITLHARKVAKEFYVKHQYEVCGDEFTEVNIPHYNMNKQL